MRQTALEMKFVLEKVSDSGLRVGRMVWRTGHMQSVLETPLCLPYTRGGAVPHLVQSVYLDVSPRPAAAMLTLPSLYELPGTAVLRDYKYGIHKFTNMKDHFLYLSVQDPHCPPRIGFNEEKSTSVWTNGGRVKVHDTQNTSLKLKNVSVAGYMDFVSVTRPDVFESLCDSVSSDCCKLKRVRKSVDRTLRFLDEALSIKQQCQELDGCGLLGAVVGGDVMEERVRSATETAKRPVDGFVIEGFDLQHSKDCLSSVIKTTTDCLPEASPRFIHGIYTPSDIFSAVESGVDVLDSACVYRATERGCAFTYHNSCPATNGYSEEERENSFSNETQGQLPAFEINLNDDKYASDFSPILRGCDCYCCHHHTRAYIHHLLLTGEILASTLLTIHNFTHHMQFFASLREVAGMASQTDYLKFKSQCLSTCLL